MIISSNSGKHSLVPQRQIAWEFLSTISASWESSIWLSCLVGSWQQGCSADQGSEFCSLCRSTHHALCILHASTNCYHIFVIRMPVSFSMQVSFHPASLTQNLSEHCLRINFQTVTHLLYSSHCQVAAFCRSHNLHQSGKLVSQKDSRSLKSRKFLGGVEQVPFF